MKYKFSPENFTVLAVDDTPANLMVLASVLNKEGYRVLTARNGESGIQRAIHGQPDIILLDIMMPKIDGFETCTRLKADPETAAIPVIFMTALDHVKHKVRGFEVGGVDYIIKPFEQAELLARIQTHLTNNQLMRHLDHEVTKQTAEIQQSLTREQDLRLSLAYSLEKEHEINRLKSNIIATISHELRTPLNAIIGFSENLIEEAEEFNNLETIYLNDIQRIRQAGSHLLQIINGILDLSKLEADQMSVNISSFEIDQMIQKVVDTVKPIIEKHGNTLLVNSQLTFYRLDSDELKIQQILLNLLTNAAKFTRNGTITLNLFQNNNGYICFSVKDTGIGISEENKAMIFDSFRQVDHSMSRVYEGTGLGLAISKQFAELLSGKIEMESELGSGSIFTLILPVSPEKMHLASFELI